MSTPSTPPAPSKTVLQLLLGSGAAMSALAVYQWFELLEVRRGGSTRCNLNETINCVTVWNSAIASRLHEWTGLPVAGLGLVWGLTATAMAGLAWREAKTPGSTAAAAAMGASKVWALTGGLVAIMFLSASLKLGHLCLTCAGTYVLVGLYVGAALKLPGPLVPAGAALLPSVARLGAAAAAAFLLLLYPGSQTPRAPKETLEARGGFDVKGFFETLPATEQQFAAFAREAWRQSPTPDVSGHRKGFLIGSPDAKVHIVDFTDVLCGHCAQFDLLMGQISKIVPEGSFSLEPRYYPLDNECNPTGGPRQETGVRCSGAKVQLCLEGNPEVFKKVRHTLFARQNELTKQLVFDIAQASGADMAALKTCVESPETQARIKDDLAYAQKFNLEGTPLVIINGRKTEPSPAFIVGMVLSGGDPETPLFSKLPPPPTR